MFTIIVCNLHDVWMVWYAMLCYAMVWYGMVCYGMYVNPPQPILGWCPIVGYVDEHNSNNWVFCPVDIYIYMLISIYVCIYIYIHISISIHIYT
jgi:hypothetical protein